MYFLSRRQFRRLVVLAAAVVVLVFSMHFGLSSWLRNRRPKADFTVRSTALLTPGWALSKVPTQEKAIALTFDDGPDPAFTPEILRLLRQYRAHATFFVLGPLAEKHPALLREIVRADSEVANHGYSHQSLNRFSVRAAEEEINRTSAIIEQAVGYRPRFYRPPYGKLPQAVSRYLLSNGEVPTLWNKDTRDWNRPRAKSIAHTVLTRLKPGAIILMHDGGGPRNQTVEALRLILPVLRREHYRLLTLSELLTLRDQKEPPAPIHQAVDQLETRSWHRRMTLALL